VITGSPGVGKTDISERLAVRLNALHIDVGELVKEEKITSGYDENRQTFIADTTKLAGRIQQIIAGTRKAVIIDGHYGTEVTPKGQLTRVFVLRCHPRQLRQRMEEKGFKGRKVKENLAAEILDVCLYEAIENVGTEKVCELDTTDKMPDAVVTEMMSVLKAKSRCLTGIVDWLGQLEMENSLDDYLKDL
jgi:adenylate kinase